MEERELNSQDEVELITPDEPVSSDDDGMMRTMDVDSDDDQVVEDADIMPLQADDMNQEAMTLMQTETTVSTNGAADDDNMTGLVLIGIMALLLVVIVLIVAWMLHHKRQTASDNQVSHPDSVDNETSDHAA